jgi:hypothetical protein
MCARPCCVWPPPPKNRGIVSSFQSSLAVSRCNLEQPVGQRIRSLPFGTTPLVVTREVGKSIVEAVGATAPTAVFRCRSRTTGGQRIRGSSGGEVSSALLNLAQVFGGHYR